MMQRGKKVGHLISMKNLAQGGQDYVDRQKVYIE